MKEYIVTYWREGPGRSDYDTVYVVARTKQDAIDHVNNVCCVHKADYDSTSARLSNRKQKAYITQS